MIRVLIVEDDADVMRATIRMLQPDFTAVPARTKTDALRILNDEQMALAAMLIDVMLGAERKAGLELLEVAAQQRPGIPRALVTGLGDKEIHNSAIAHLAFLLRKPFEKERLAAFLDTARPEMSVDFLARTVAFWSNQWELSTQQALIVRRLAARNTRHEVENQLDISHNTLRAHIANILRKAGMPTLEELLLHLLRDALAASARHASSPRGRGRVSST
jgi:FixJ family two-component response regulator